MSQDQPAGPVVHSFFAGHLITVKGLRPVSGRSYRDTILSRSKIRFGC